MVSKCQNGFIHYFFVVDKNKFEFEFHQLLNDFENSKFHIYHVPNFHISHGLCFLATLDLRLCSWQKRRYTLNFLKIKKLRSSCNGFWAIWAYLLTMVVCCFLSMLQMPPHWHFFLLSQIWNYGFWILSCASSLFSFDRSGGKLEIDVQYMDHLSIDYFKWFDKVSIES